MEYSVESAACYRKRLAAETGKIIVGKERQIDLILMAIFSGGHVLLNDLPGSGKTTLIKTLSAALGCGFYAGPSAVGHPGHDGFQPENRGV